MSRGYPNATPPPPEGEGQHRRSLPWSTCCTSRPGTTAATPIILVGEFDMTGTERFWAHLSEAVETVPESIIVEARGLTFIDSSGLMALLRARDAAAEADVGSV
jgi:STAS domain